MTYAYDNGIMKENSIVYKDLYENESALAATDYFRRQRIKKDQKWTTYTEFGTLDITINLSKPEKDPKAIAAAKKSR